MAIKPIPVVSPRSCPSQIDSVDAISRYVVKEQAEARVLLHVLSSEFQSSSSMVTAGILFNFKHPDRAKTNGYLDVVKHLYHKVDSLAVTILKLGEEFKDVSKAQPVLNKMSAFRSSLEKQLSTALSKLSEIAAGHVPPAFRVSIDKVRKVLHSYEGTYAELTDIDLVRVSDSDYGQPCSQFTHYFCMHRAKDDQGFVHQKYYVVLTGVVDPFGSYRLYVTTLPSFQLPGQFALGVKTDDIVGAATDLLDTEGIKPTLQGATNETD